MACRPLRQAPWRRIDSRPERPPGPVAGPADGSGGTNPGGDPSGGHPVGHRPCAGGRRTLLLAHRYRAAVADGAEQRRQALESAPAFRRRLGLFVYGLAHMDRDAATRPFFFLEHPVAEPGVEGDVLGEELVGVEPDVGKTQGRREALDMRHQPSAQPQPLACRQDSEIFDDQMVRMHDRLDEACERAIAIQQVEAVRAHGRLVIRTHRLGLAADNGNPFGVSRPRQLTDSGSVGYFRLAQFLPQGSLPRGNPMASRCSLSLIRWFSLAQRTMSRSSATIGWDTKLGTRKRILGMKWTECPQGVASANS